MSLADVLALPRRVSLRPVTLDDVPALHGGFSDPEVMRYWSTPPHATMAQTERWVTASIESAAARRSIEMAALHEGELVGRVGLWQGNEIGFLFLRSAWGKGLAREA